MAFRPRKRGLFLYADFFSHTQETTPVLEHNWILFDIEYNMTAGIANRKEKAEKTRFYLIYNYVTGG